ncbi:MAG TPA: hypothetical protein VNQ80_15275 [Parapedobacter sp.]|uniref:hypothetical protein n=1 Tax=Parapedobacter sp. TaxID=1958893 RepID=UPI002C433D0E|nr:hypothetical protein [Parapedobacter sp.]HWK58703.1 hypothetical protein [Parapedobacter sp.]
MKKSIILALVALPLLAISQEAEKKTDDSKLAEFSAKTGTLIQKQHTDIGKLASVKFESAVITNLITGEVLKGLRLEKTSSKQYGRDAYAFIDADEIDGLLKSIEIIRDKVIPSTPTAYTEVSFKGRSGFEAGCFFNDKSEWRSYLQVDKYNSDSVVFFSANELNELKALLEKAKANISI